MITGNVKTLELFKCSYSLLVGDINILIVALRIRNPSPKICHAMAKSVKVNLSRVLEPHLIIERKWDTSLPSLSIYIYEIVDYEMDLRGCGLHLDMLYMVR